MLSLRDLAFAYSPGPTVFDGVSAEIGPGVTWVVGDESSGKTTLLKLVAGVLTARGAIAVDGQVLGDAPRPVAWLDSADEAVDRLAVGTVIDRVRAAAPSFDDAVFERHVAGFGLAPHLGKSMFQLSTGTRRKVGLAAVLAMNAPVTLLDDPAAALDAPSVAHLLRVLAEADREPGRLCLVTAYAAPEDAPPNKVLALPPPR